MEGISDIKIIGIDEKRPPKIRKEPYIDIAFKLSHQAPEDWCDDFNRLLTKHPSAAKIKVKEGVFIEAWVKVPDDIIKLLTHLKTKVTECSKRYIERIELATRNAGDANAAMAEESGEQGRLNRIIDALEFDEIEAK